MTEDRATEIGSTTENPPRSLRSFSKADAVTAAVAVVVSGAPGAGKTTLARALADAMWIPHLNKDVVARSLMRRVPYEVANKAAFELVYGTARTWLDGGLSLVMDLTMYPEHSIGEVTSLMPHGTVINVHCRAVDSLARWREKMHVLNPPEQAEAIIEQLTSVQDIATEPLDFDCPRIEVATDDGYDPTLDELIRRIEDIHGTALPTTGWRPLR